MLCDDASTTAIAGISDRTRASPHLARWGITPRDDDGVAIARGRLDGLDVIVAAQDERFLGGSVGAGQAAALQAMFAHARTQRPDAVILLLASGGVRLHEANPAEVALARALAALLALRIAGIPVIALGVADVFGGASVLACAADRLGLLPDARLGVSGPRVIAAERGREELDADDPAAVAAVFGARARARRGELDLVAEDRGIVRAWVTSAIAARITFAEAVQARQAWLRRALRRTDAHATSGSTTTPWQLPAGWRKLAQAVDHTGALWRLPRRPVWIAAAAGAHHLDPQRLTSLDTALLRHVLRAARTDGATLVLVEDSLGHEPSVTAESIGIARFLAHHAAVLALLRAAGVRVVGVLVGQGHSAAFFVNALQAEMLHVLASATVVAMDPRNVARVTRLDAEALEACIAEDPALGHPAPLLVHWDPAIAVAQEADGALLERIAAG
ncbi:MAG: biotin-independent malonate decarboxylase subunit gamma [Casimicrobiaceae bacterium]